MLTNTEQISFSYADVSISRPVRKANGGGPWIFKLEHSFSRKLPALRGIAFSSAWLSIESDGTVTIPAGYAWDGNSKKFNILDLWVVGTPDGRIDIETGKPKTWYASLVHDALYQYYGYHGLQRREMDGVYRLLAKESRFLLTPVYWFIIRLLGGIFFVKKRKRVLVFPERKLVLYKTFYDPEEKYGNAGN